MTYNGGYFLLREPLVRGTGPNAHTARDLTKLGEYTVAAVNHVQDTPWEVNRFILDVVAHAADVGANLKNSKGDVVLRVEKPINPKDDPFELAFQTLPPDIWVAMPKDEKKAYIAKRSRLMNQYEERLSTYRATKTIIDGADEMSEHRRFYFPHNLDFRLRMYPIPTSLTPQGNDLAKGLLKFHRGTRLGAEGLYWMGVAVATHWGKDKLSMDDRNSFAKEMLKGEWNYLDADKPFQFLAVFNEWTVAHQLTDPEGFISHLPGNMDGSCNGAQHLSVMSRDKVGAIATNCSSLKERRDLYLEVANRSYEQVLLDLSNGNSEAAEWVKKMTADADRRDIVKRSVMTKFYGVTNYGVANFMVSDGHVDAESENQWGEATYMRDLILASLTDTMRAGIAVQNWFSECAILLAEAGLPLCWDTPAGSKVTQAYRQVIEKRIRSYNTRFLVYSEATEEESREDHVSKLTMRVNKMGTSAPPNVVHSCDAAHLQITVCRMAEAGIHDFSMIHDSFGCPFAYVGLMRDILRKSMVDMYSGDYLQTWKESVEGYSGLTMPDPPERGDFDINEILTSEYFFS